MFATKQNVGMGRVVMDATQEARRRGDRRIGSDHLLLALLTDEDSVTARAVGVDLSTARGALVELDRRALASVGIDIPVTDTGLTAWRRERLMLSPSAKAVFTGLRTRAKGERLGVQHVCCRSCPSSIPILPPICWTRWELIVLRCAAG